MKTINSNERMYMVDVEKKFHEPGTVFNLRVPVVGTDVLVDYRVTILGIEKEDENIMIILYNANDSSDGEIGRLGIESVIRAHKAGNVKFI